MKRTLSVILAMVMLVTALVLPVQAEEFILESEHPYEGGVSSMYVYEYDTQDDGFFVTFDEKTSLTPDGWRTTPQPDWTMEDVYENYVEGDVIFVYQNYREISYAHLADDEDALFEFIDYCSEMGYDCIDRERLVLYGYDDTVCYSGTELAGKSLYINGDYLAVELVSCSEITDYGFAVDYIGTEVPDGASYVHYNIGEESYYDLFTEGEGLFVNSRWIDYLDSEPNYVITGWATEPDGEKVYDSIGYIEDGETETNFIPYSKENIELYPIFERAVYSITYVYDDYSDQDFFAVDEEIYISPYFALFVDTILFKGWSEDKDATEAEYFPGEILEEKRDYVLYPVMATLNEPLIGLDECWNFDNYSGEAMNAEAKYEMMIRNAVKTWAINPALWVPAALYTSYISKEIVKPTGGHCFGMALTVILNHYGYIDLLEGREESCVADLPHDEYTDTIIHYYHTIQTQGVLCDQVATENNTDLYRIQLKNMCESLKAGNVVQLSPSWNNLNMTDVIEKTIDFGGHSMALVAVSEIPAVQLFPDSDNEENVDIYKTGVVCDKVITLYDSNYPGQYKYIYVAEDYSYMIYEGQVYGAFRWGDDFSHFESFDHEGNSNHLSWHIAFIKNIIKFIKTIVQLFAVKKAA